VQYFQDADQNNSDVVMHAKYFFEYNYQELLWLFLGT